MIGVCIKNFNQYKILLKTVFKDLIENKDRERSYKNFFNRNPGAVAYIYKIEINKNLYDTSGHSKPYSPNIDYLPFEQYLKLYFKGTNLNNNEKI